MFRFLIVNDPVGLLCRGDEAYHIGHGARCRLYPGQAAGTTICFHTSGQFRVTSSSNSHLFELWEETGANARKSCSYGRTCKLNTKGCSWPAHLNPGTSYCEMAELSTTPRADSKSKQSKYVAFCKSGKYSDVRGFINILN